MKIIKIGAVFGFSFLLLVCTTQQPAASGNGKLRGLQYEIVNNSSIRITKYTGRLQRPVVPEQIYGLPVTAIGNKAFAGNYRLTNITIPSTVTTIGVWAFANTGLKSVTIPSSVVYIGGGAFDKTPLIRVTLSRQTKVGISAFPSITQINYSD